MRLLTLLSAAKQGAGKLADEIGRSAAMAAAALLVAAHECVHGKAPESASPVAGGAVDAARAGNCVGCWRILRFGVGVCGVGGRAAVRAATADGRLARGQIPLRHAGADLDVYGHVSVAAGGSGDGSVAHSSICETRCPTARSIRPAAWAASSRSGPSRARREGWAGCGRPWWGSGRGGGVEGGEAGSERGAPRNHETGEQACSLSARRPVHHDMTHARGACTGRR